MTGDAFTARAETFPAPSVAPGDIVVPDNLPAHKIRRARAAIEAAGSRCPVLPPCAPDVNPIEGSAQALSHLAHAATAPD